MEHKMAAYRYHLERMYSLPLNYKMNGKPSNKLQTATIFQSAFYIKWKKEHSNFSHNQQPQKKKKDTKWTTFTYTTPHIRKINNLFKNTDIKIAFRTSNTLRQFTKPPTQNPTPPQDCSGICGLTCNTWQMTYVGQTSRNLNIRYKEHIPYIRTNNPKSAYALHILQNRHEYGPLNETMRLLNQVNKTTSLIPYERLYIQTLHQAGKHIPEQFPGDPNPLLPTVIVPHSTQT